MPIISQRPHLTIPCLKWTRTLSRITFSFIQLKVCFKDITGFVWDITKTSSVERWRFAGWMIRKASHGSSLGGSAAGALIVILSTHHNYRATIVLLLLTSPLPTLPNSWYSPTPPTTYIATPPTPPTTQPLLRPFPFPPLPSASKPPHTPTPPPCDKLATTPWWACWFFSRTFAVVCNELIPNRSEKDKRGL